MGAIMKYARFYRYDEKLGVNQQLLGSDSFLKLDSRKNTVNLIFDCISRMNSLLTVKPFITGFVIYESKNLRDNGKRLCFWFNNKKLFPELMENEVQK